MLRCPRLFALNYIWYEHSDQKSSWALSPRAFFLRAIAFLICVFVAQARAVLWVSKQKQLRGVFATRSAPSKEK